MESGPPRPVDVAVRPNPLIPSQRTAAAVRATAVASTPDEPIAVVFVGARDSGQRALVRALLDGGAAQPPGSARAERAPAGSVPVDPPPASYVVLRHGPAGAAYAHVPGVRRPLPYPAPASGAVSDRVAGGPDGATPSRPPRRIELTLPHPLLRHFTVVEAPDARTLGVAGARVLACAAERGGAVVFVAAGDRALSRSELDVLAELSTRDVTVFFAVGAADAEPDPVGAADAEPDPGGAALDLAGGGDRVGRVLDLHRAAVARQVPALADARWFAVDTAAGDTAYLRRALVEWASVEGLRRASDNPPVPPGAGDAVRLSERAADSGWDDHLDRWLLATTRSVRQRLAIEVANIHLRCVQEVVFGAGSGSLPEALDGELHALSELATAVSDQAVTAAVDDALRHVLASELTEDVRRRAAAAVRRGLPDTLARVLLVTATGGVAALTGAEALRALPGYLAEGGAPVLPPVGLAVSGACYVSWRGFGVSARNEAERSPAARTKEVPAVPQPEAARAWLQQATRAVELELLREVSRRFDAVHRSLGSLVGETVDHGVLLA